MTTLTEQEKIELLATKVMGWHLKDEPHVELYYTDDEGNTTEGDARHWNPYTNWSHTHMVLDKLMEDISLVGKIMRYIGISEKDAPDIACGRYMKATKTELMDAVISLITL